MSVMPQDDVPAPRVPTPRGAAWTWRSRLRTLPGALMLTCAVMVLALGPIARSGAAQPLAAVVHKVQAAVVIDGASTVYGLSGTFAAPCLATVCQGTIGVTKVARTGSSYLRFSVNLDCEDGIGEGAQPTRGNVGTIGDLLKAARGANLIPVLDVVPRSDCPDAAVLTPDQWKVQLAHFVATMHGQGWYPASRWIYFEIGNEPNLTPERYSYLYGSGRRASFGYADVFKAAAQGVQTGMRGTTRYRVITAGMIAPSALVTCTTAMPYPQARPHYTNLDLAADAIAAAERGPDPVSSQHLAVGVHPYKYNTDQIATYWRNYYYWGTHYSGACYDLGNLIATWTGRFPGLPIFFTEANWSDQPQAALHCTNVTACEGTYMIDLFTWLHDHRYDDPRTSPLRVTFFRGADADLSLGLYGYRGNDKPFWTGYCPLAPAAAGWKSLANAFTTMTISACY